MSVCVDNFTTSKFILRTQEAADHINRLVELLQDEENLACGYQGGDFYANIYDSGNLTFEIDTGNYCDGGPDLKRSVVYPSDEGDATEYYDDDYINLWSEIQERLKEDTYFAVTNHSIEKCGLSFRMTLYHSNGKVFTKSSYDVEEELTKKLFDEDK